MLRLACRDGGASYAATKPPSTRASARCEEHYLITRLLRDELRLLGSLG
ncbi:MAG: hypothetical protein WD939_06250 [Dehalococcoidia bacterium]